MLKLLAVNKLEIISQKYDALQTEYGNPALDSIKFGGCTNKPDLFLVFMNPTKANIASSKNWRGIKAPWIGTKNIWKLLRGSGLLSETIYKKTQALKSSEWSTKFAEQVYSEATQRRIFITNLGKCTQLDARPLPDRVLRQYLDLLFEEIAITKPRAVVTFSNQVSSIVLGEKISVSKCRKKCYQRTINGYSYKVYPLYYPVGQGMRNLDKAIEDLRYVKATL
jgi:DNA polymerase